jgi:hypothetical protein
MARWLGIVVSGNGLVAVDANVPANGPIEIISDSSWPLPKGDRPVAYGVIYDRVANYVRENQIEKVIIKASASTGKGGGLSFLLSAELRGVVAASAASIVKNVFMLAKSKITKTFGDRKADEYLKDDDYWTAEIEGEPLRMGSREAALLLLATRENG